MKLPSTEEIDTIVSSISLLQTSLSLVFFVQLVHAFLQVLKNLRRAWCIFESYVCIDNDFPITIILPERARRFLVKIEMVGFEELT